MENIELINLAIEARKNAISPTGYFVGVALLTTEGKIYTGCNLGSEDALFNIPGNVPNPVNMPNYCYFKERCLQCVEKCSGDYPCMVQVSPTHFVACHLYGEKEE